MLLEFVGDERVPIGEVTLENPDTQFLDARPRGVDLDGGRLVPLAVETTVGREIHQHRMPVASGLLDGRRAPLLPIQPLDLLSRRRAPVQLTLQESEIPRQNQ